HLRVQGVGEADQGDAHVTRRLLHHRARAVVTKSRAGEQLCGGLARFARQGRAAHERLQAASLAAVVERPVGVDDHVPDLAGGAVRAPVEPAVDDQAAAYTGRPGDVD